MRTLHRLRLVQIAELNTRCEALTAEKAAQAAALGEKDQQLQQLSTNVRCCQVVRLPFVLTHMQVWCDCIAGFMFLLCGMCVRSFCVSS